MQAVASRRLVGLGVVVALHAAFFFALASGLSRKMVAVAHLPIMAAIIEDIRPALPHPEVKPVVKPTVKPVPLREVKAERPVEAAPAAITEPPAPPVAAPVAVAVPVRVAAVLDAGRSCQPPQYPPSARRAGESGAVVIKFLIEADGTVSTSAVEKSSGFERLDEAARAALGLCRFRPGTVDGRPEQSWARIQYVWRLN